MKTFIQNNKKVLIISGIALAAGLIWYYKFRKPTVNIKVVSPTSVKVTAQQTAATLASKQAAGYVQPKVVSAATILADQKAATISVLAAKSAPKPLLSPSGQPM